MSTELNFDLIFDVFILLVCLIASGFFSASETAITSIGKLKTKHLLESFGNRKVEHLKLWLDFPERVITTMLVFNTAVNILASAIATKLAIAYSHDYGVGIATGLTTFVVLIFGEVVPKSFGKAHSDTLGLAALKPVYLLYRCIYPLVRLLSGFAQILLRGLGDKDISLRPTITEEELEFLINESQSQGVIKDFKKEMISGIFEFDETKVREIMTPRIDISAIERTESIEELEKLFVNTGHSRIPVYEDTIDNIVGIVFAKDLLRLHLQNENESKLKISDIIRDPFFVPDSKTIIEIFKDLKRKRLHIAIVLDEHGGTGGLVTMEDILEEIVGEIQDEYDVEEAKIKKVDKDIYDVAGSVNINEFTEFFDLDESLIEETDHDSDTLAGFMVHLLGDLPKIGQKSQIGPLTLEVSELGRKRRRIEKIRVTRNIEGLNNSTLNVN